MSGWRNYLAEFGRTFLYLFIIGWFIFFGGMIIRGCDNVTSLFTDDLSTGEPRVDCEELEADLQKDRWCERSGNCVFTRDEYAAFQSRVDLYSRRCPGR